MKLIEEKLIELKNKYNLYAVKVDLESEIISFESIKRLRDIVDKLNLKFVVKIGGCGAIRDIFLCKPICPDIIVAPMIETQYSLKKFITSCEEIYSEATLPRLNINIETITGVEKFDEIISQNCNNFSGIVFGRSDFKNSINIDNVDCALVCNYVEDIRAKAQKLNKDFIIGGNITSASIPFIEKLNPTYVETRNLVFEPHLSAEAIKHYIEFEILWLQTKCPQTPQDTKRLEMLKSRL